jgi:hypothetical protein
MIFEKSELRLMLLEVSFTRALEILFFSLTEIYGI